MKSLGTHCRNDVSVLDLSGKSVPVLVPDGSDMRTTKTADARENAAVSNISNGPQSPDTNGQKKQRIKAMRKSKSHRLLPKMSTATLSPTKEESLGDDESSEDGNRRQKRESVIQRLQRVEKNRKVSTVNQIPNTVKVPNGLEGRQIHDPQDTHLKDNTCKKTNGQQICETEDPTEHAQVYIESIPPRESSRQSKLHEENEKLNLPSSCNDDGRQPSLNLRGIGQGMTQPEGTCPNDDNVDVQTSTKGKNPAWGSLLSSAELSGGGIRVVESSPTNGDQQTGRNTSASRQKPADLDNSFRVGSHDRGVQCSIVADMQRRDSINTTPERFYPNQQARKEAQHPNDAYNIGALRKKEVTQREFSFLHKPRLSKSHEQLRTQAIITVQSPTESTESKSLSKQSSVKAMAAIFETQTLGCSCPAFTEDTNAVSENVRRHSRRRYSRSEPACINYASDLSLQDFILPKVKIRAPEMQQGEQLHDVRGVLDKRNNDIGSPLNNEVNKQIKHLSRTGARFKVNTKSGKPDGASMTGNGFKVLPSLGR